MWLTILRSQVATVLVLAIALAAVVGCGDADQPPAPPEPSPSPTVVPPLSPGQVGVSLGIERGWPGSGPIVSEIVLEPGDEFIVVVNADTNGEVVTVGEVELAWDASALRAVERLFGDLIGSTPFGGYELIGSPDVTYQGSLRYSVYDAELPDETPPGVLGRFRFRVADGRFGEPRAEEGAFPIELTWAAVTDETEFTPQPMGRLPFEGSGVEAVLRGAVVVRVEDP
jgi:hypothetical protein